MCEEKEFTLLVRRRGSVKQRLTLFQRYLVELITASESENFVVEEECALELESRLNAALSLMSDYEEIQLQIELTVSESEIEKQFQDRSGFQSQYYSCTSKGKRLLNSFRENLKDEIEYNRVRELKLCLNCLKSGHFVTRCRIKALCNKCNGKHNTLLHHEAIEQGENSKGSDAVVTLSSFSSNMVLLSTVSLEVLDKTGKPRLIRAVLDCGSQSSYVTSNLVKQLGLPETPIEIKMVGLSCTSTKIESKSQVTVRSRHNNFSTSISCLVIPEITNQLPEFSFNLSQVEIPQHLRLADPQFNKASRVDMLIGADIFWNLLCAAQINLGSNKPVLQKTKFGWIVSGPLGVGGQEKFTHCNLSVENDLQRQVCKLWEIENEFSEIRKFSKEEQMCEDHFTKTARQDQDGRFVVSIPLKSCVSLLGESKNRAIRQFQQLEHKFANNIEFKNMYVDFMEEYERMGHMTKVNDKVQIECAYYLPHHGVLRESSETTKLRVVYNASSPTTTGYSFNDLQMVGPTIQSDLITIILRFRQHTYVACADIEKMYRQVLVEERERSLQRIVWRSDTSLPISTFNLNTVTYGTASAPFLAIRCLFELAKLYENECPEVVNIIRHDMYVDDVITGSDSLESLQQNCVGLLNILERGQFFLRKWISNSEKVLEGIDKSRWSSSSKGFGKEEEEKSKTLGLMWLPQSDQLSYDINIAKISRMPVKELMGDVSIYAQ
ncbi:uncharacterized protein LOC111691441 [Anoplophora glabripennis]|uniref:uncharacterized protein LOC111691441 n=1 Tax=Anoplophora glabripennis TaxID=217634 RepID=UPI000C77133F|nr:uncharacterized protein LOC111691441 [Anoplophora glabripennis]